ncbi:MAG TPA: VWA domain-containing protein [Candidatus Solibacter sp.]|nr:VWA domain-containing protein [Candidatus Solibacter sp.]
MKRLILAALFTAPLLAQQSAPQPTQGPAAPPTVIKTETREVLVDVVVTDKKNNYIQGLEMKDFKVWEDNKEQQLKSFSFGADAASPDGNKQRYLVLFFDASTMNTNEQAQSRQQAAKFIASNAGPDRQMAVVNFTGALQVAQNFTDDISRLQSAVQGIKLSAVTANASAMGGAMGGLGRAERDFGARSMLLGLISMARGLGDVKGRKSLILFTSGFRLTDQTRTELTAAIAQCNKSNVAVYPIDARGLAGGGLLDNDPLSNPNMRGGRGRAALELPGDVRRTGVALAAFPVMHIVDFFLDQARGGGAPPGGSTTGGGTGGGGTGGGGAGGGGRSGGIGGGGGMTGNPGGNPGGRTGNPGNPGGNPNGGNPINRGGNNPFGGNPNDPNNPNNPNNRDRFGAGRGIMPEFPQNLGDRKEIMYALANGTGGFMIENTNDLLSGLERIGREQNQYYVLAYAPPDSPEGSCHTLKVKVDRGGTQVRARTGYCNVKSRDSLAGSAAEKTLESRITTNAAPVAASAGKGAAAMRAPFFYTSPETARVAVAMEIPLDKTKFEKVKGKQHAALNLLGIAYRQDGTVAARFSDSVKFDFESSKEADKFKTTPLHYENQFDVGTGSYTLKVAYDSGGENAGTLQTPLSINAYDGKQFAVSGLALSTKFGPSNQAEINMDTILMEGRAPLVAGNLQFTPSGAVRFSRNDTVVMYFEVYEPLLSEEKPPQLGAQVRIVDASGAEKSDSGTVAINNYVRQGSPVVAAGLKVPVQGLTSGAYKVEVKALDSAGNFAVRTADFVIE